MMAAVMGQCSAKSASQLGGAVSPTSPLRPSLTGMRSASMGVSGGLKAASGALAAGGGGGNTDASSAVLGKPQGLVGGGASGGNVGVPPTAYTSNLLKCQSLRGVPVGAIAAAQPGSELAEVEFQLVRAVAGAGIAEDGEEEDAAGQPQQQQQSQRSQPQRGSVRESDVALQELEAALSQKVCMCVCVCMYVCMLYACMHVCMRVCVCMYVYAYACMRCCRRRCVCMCARVYGCRGLACARGRMNGASVGP